MDTQHLAAFRTQACQIVIPSQSYLGIAMKFTLYLIMAYIGQFLGKGPATKLDDFLEKFQTAFDPPLPPRPLIFGKSCWNLFIMDMVAYMQGGKRAR